MKNVASKTTALRGAPAWSRTERIAETGLVPPIGRRPAGTPAAPLPPAAPAAAAAVRFLGAVLIIRSRTLGALVRKDLTAAEVRPLARSVQGQIRSSTLPLSNGAALLAPDFIGA